jgi:hypothetical protein
MSTLFHPKCSSYTRSSAKEAASKPLLFLYYVSYNKLFFKLKTQVQSNYKTACHWPPIKALPGLPVTLKS